jgi:hypothetical protein
MNPRSGGHFGTEQAVASASSCKGDEIMTKRKRQEGRVDLGRASERTLGSTGDYPDFVRTMDHWGIARD